MCHHILFLWQLQFCSALFFLQKKKKKGGGERRHADMNKKNGFSKPKHGFCNPIFFFLWQLQFCSALFVLQKKRGGGLKLLVGLLEPKRKIGNPIYFGGVQKYESKNAYGAADF